VTAAVSLPSVILTRTQGRVRISLPLLALATDAAVMVAVLVSAIAGRAHLPVFANSADVSGSVTLAGPAIMLGWLCMIALFGGYRATLFGAGSDEFRCIINASFVAAGLVGVGCFLMKFQLSRGFFLLAFALGIPALVAGRYVLRSLLHSARRRGSLMQRTLIAGSPSHIDEVARVLRRERWLGYDIVGALTPGGDSLEETALGIPVTGDVCDPLGAVHDMDVDVIFFADGAVGSAGQLKSVLWGLEQRNVHVIVAPSVTDISRERVRVRPVGGLPLLHIDPTTGADAVRWGKRLFDIVGSFTLLLALSPLFLLAAVRIKLHDRGPMLFRQTRVGRDGVQFSCLKFRTMVIDAEKRLAELHAASGYESGLFKLQDDPRITGPGRWLRRYSLDELPQLVNVLRGDMSLVGPRPPLPLEVAQYETHTHRRLRVRPGMTGLWQVSGRSDLSWSETVRLDLYYVDNWSMLQDLSILARTFGAVLSSRGAF